MNKMDTPYQDYKKRVMQSGSLGTITVYEFKDQTAVEIQGSITWDGQDTSVVIQCENISKLDQDIHVAISWVEARMNKLFQSLPLSSLRRWCLSKIEEELPWFLTENILEPDSGNVPITSKPEEMIDLLIPEIRVRYDFATNKKSVEGQLSCPPLESENEVNHDVNRWLGNHDYIFSLDDNNALSGFGADG